MKQKKITKILCLCKWGISRSVYSAISLRHIINNVECKARSLILLGKNPVSNKDLEWADKIIMFYSNRFFDKNNKVFIRKYPKYIGKTLFIYQEDIWDRHCRNEEIKYFENMFSTKKFRGLLK